MFSNKAINEIKILLHINLYVQFLCSKFQVTESLRRKSNFKDNLISRERLFGQKFASDGGF